MAKKTVEKDKVVEETKILEKPDWLSPQWSDYVMQQFADNELINAKPTCDGLRRVFQKLVGPILSLNVHIPHCPSDERHESTVVVTIEYQDSRVENIPSRYISDAFNVSKDNTPWPWHTASVATATTKAEARALRKGIGLTKVLSNEEAEQGFDNMVSNNPDIKAKSLDEVSSSSNGKISDLSKVMINTLAMRCSIDISKMLKELGIEVTLENISNNQAKLIIQTLEEYQRKRDTIPASIKRESLDL